MKRFMKILGIAGFSSVYVMQGACQFTGHGFSVIPTVPSIQVFLRSLGIPV